MARLNRLSAIYVTGTKADPTDDVRTISVALRSHRPGAPDIAIEWDDERREKVEDAFIARVNAAWIGHASTIHRLVRLRWHEIGEKREEGYPVLREREYDVAGTFGQPLPLQVSCAVTFETPVRKRWGRVYMPGLTINALDGQARFTAAFRNAMANAWKAFFDDLWDLSTWTSSTEGAYPVVIARNSLADAVPGVEWQKVERIRVDDVPDIIRSRRWKRATARSIVDLANVP